MTDKTTNIELYESNFKFLFNKELEKIITDHNNIGIDVFDFDKEEDELEYCVLITSRNISLMDFLFDGNEIEVKLTPEVEDNIIHLVIEATLESKRFNIKKDVSFRVTPDDLDDLKKSHQRLIEPCVEALTEYLINDAIINKYRDQIKPIKVKDAIFTGEIDLEAIWTKEFKEGKR